MRLTSFTDYSLRVLMFLAAEPDRRATIAEIAQGFAISKNHLMKVVHFLGQQGLLANVRGKGGGLQLARAPEKITLGSVVRATEDSLPAECFDRESNTCCIAPACELKAVLGEAVKAFYAVLDRHTLADVVRNPKALAKILVFSKRPPAAAAERA
jgi:Rrf2 family nitric oxide-sensitive transcriptional repressor